MGVADKLNQMVSSIQSGAKNASQSMLGMLIKLVSVFFVGLTLAMIGQEVLTYGTISFVFVLLFTGLALLRILWSWSLGATLIFDLICVLLALLLRMYVLIAP